MGFDMNPRDERPIDREEYEKAMGTASVDMCGLQKAVDDACAKIDELRAALKEAIDAIELFHGRPGWELYRDHSPEMKRWRKLLAKPSKRKRSNVNAL
jgi:hypothetical protein